MAGKLVCRLDAPKIGQGVLYLVRFSFAEHIVKNTIGLRSFGQDGKQYPELTGQRRCSVPRRFKYLYRMSRFSEAPAFSYSDKQRDRIFSYFLHETIQIYASDILQLLKPLEMVLNQAPCVFAI